METRSLFSMRQSSCNILTEKESVSQAFVQAEKFSFLHPYAVRNREHPPTDSEVINITYSGFA